MFNTVRSVPFPTSRYHDSRYHLQYTGSTCITHFHNCFLDGRYYVCAEITATLGNLLGEIYLYRSVRLEVDINVHSSQSGWSNILTVGTGGVDHDVYGNRWPSIYVFPNDQHTNQLHISMHISNSVSCADSQTDCYVRDVNPVITFDQWYSIIFEQYQFDGKQYVRVELDGVEIFEEENMEPQQIPAAKIMASNALNTVADASIRNLRITSLPLVRVWSPWTEFSDCSQTCATDFGTGTRTRTRSCLDSNTGYPAINCAKKLGGVASESRICNTGKCPGLRQSCQCDNNQIRCRSTCKGKASCELTSWFQPNSNDNVYKCQDKSYTECKGWGDPHIVTYDNAKTDVYGIAQYLMSGHDGTENGIPAFKVLMNTKAYNKVSAIEYMYISFPLRSGDMVEIETDRYGGANFYTTAFGWNKLYPQKNIDFEYKKRGKKHSMKTWFGLSIEHNGLTYVIHAPGYYDDETFGLCMNKNMDKIDDYAMKNGTLLPMPPQGGYKRTWQEYESATSWIVGGVDLRGCLQYDDGNQDVTEELLMHDAGPTMAEKLDCNPVLKAEVEAECDALFDAAWIKPCTDIIDPSQTIEDCYVDYCMDKTLETKLDVLSKYIDECSKQLEPDAEVICEWPVLSGLSVPECGDNQVWKGCANSCEDVTECNEGAKDCTDDEDLAPLCICVDGFVMSDGLCILETDCPIASDTFSEWGTWGACSVTCGSGTKSRVRLCLAQSCSGVSEDSASCNTCSCTGESILHFETPDNVDEYTFAHIVWTGMDDIFFSVEATNDIAITISQHDQALTSGWEIILGGWAGTKSVIRAYHHAPPLVEVSHTLEQFNEVCLNTF